MTVKKNFDNHKGAFQRDYPNICYCTRATAH